MLNSTTLPLDTLRPAASSITIHRMGDSQPASRHSVRSRLGLAATAALLAANVVVPLALGDFYPFTSAPMFRDCRGGCCNYRVFAADGSELPASDWLLQRVYDGNPVGYGVGACPPPVLEQDFGRVHTETEVRRHVTASFSLPQNAAYQRIEVVQEVIGLAGRQRVGVVRTHRWQIERPQP